MKMCLNTDRCEFQRVALGLSCRFIASESGQTAQPIATCDRRYFSPYCKSMIGIGLRHIRCRHCTYPPLRHCSHWAHRLAFSRQIRSRINGIGVSRCPAPRVGNILPGVYRSATCGLVRRNDAAKIGCSLLSTRLTQARLGRVAVLHNLTRHLSH